MNHEIQTVQMTLNAETDYTQTFYIVPVTESPYMTSEERCDFYPNSKGGVLLVMPLMHFSWFVPEKEYPTSDAEHKEMYDKVLDQLFWFSLVPDVLAPDVADQITSLLRLQSFYVRKEGNEHGKENN